MQKLKSLLRSIREKLVSLSIRHDLGMQLMFVYTLFVGLVVLITYFFARTTRERLERDIKAADLALARALAQETDVEMHNALIAVRELASMDAVLKSDHDEMERLFESVLKVRPDISYIHQVNNQGFLIYHYPSGPESYIGSDLSDQDYYQRAQLTTRSLISKGSISPITNQPVASAVMPLWDEKAQFKGLIATNIKLESLSLTLKKIADEYPEAEEFQVLIIDSKGQIIAHQDSDQLLKEIPESMSDVMNAVLLGRASNLIKLNEDGRQVLYSFVPIPRSGWGVIVSHPTDKAFASSTTFSRGILLVLVIFVMTGVIFWIGLNQKAIRPLTHLVQYSQTIGSQEQLPVKNRNQLSSLVQRDDQVGNLTNSLVRMEKSINARLNELSSLLKTSAYVLSSLESQTVLKRILNQVKKLIDVEMSAIVALDETQGLYRVQASHGFSDNYIKSLNIDPDDPESMTSRAIHSGLPVQVSDTETDPSFISPRERARAEGYRSILAIPLNTQHAPPSALLIFKPEPHIFSEQEITLISNFANQAAMAIENASLFARSDTRLQEQTRRLEALIDSMNDGLILGNLEKSILYVNRSAIEWTELSLEDLIGSDITRYIHALLNNAENSDQSYKEILAAMDRQDQRPFEITIQQSRGKYHLRLRIFNVTGSHSDPIGFGLILQDITSDFELDRLKSSLISTVSHELRTPLASIKGYTTTLLAEDISWDLKSQKEFLRIISDETDRMSSLVRDLLDLSRIEAGDDVVRRSACDFIALVDKAAKCAHPPPGLRLKLDFQSDFPLIRIDEKRIEVVMRNLIENATKYAGPQSPIKVFAELDNGNLIVRVEDEGPGIPVDESDRIFESFYRLNREVSTSHPGFGLGLSICQGFIKAHGGQIWTEPSETGACIGFSLPITGKG